MRFGPARRLVAAVAVAAALVLTPSAAFAAAPPVPAPLEISHDGSTFAVDNEARLFDAIDRVVPGDRLTESIWARSAAQTVGRLGIELTDVVANDRALAEAMSIAVRVDGTLVGSVTVSDAVAGCVVIADSTLLAPGDTARVDAELAVAAALGDDSSDGQGGSVGFGLRVTLTDAAMPEQGPGPCGPGPVVTPTSSTGTGALPETGVPPVGVLAILAAAAVAVGWATMRSRRAQ